MAGTEKPRWRRSLALFAAMVLLAGLGWIASDRSAPAPSARRVGPRGASGSPAPHAVRSTPEDCDATERALREALDALPPLEPLEGALALARGQAARVAGRPIPWTGQADDEAALRAAARAQGAREPDTMDCEEYPCILHWDDQKAVPTREQRDAIRDGLGLVYGGGQYRGGPVHAWIDPDLGLDADSVHARVRFRLKLRYRPVPLAFEPPETEPAPPPHACGPDVSALERELHDARTLRERAEAELAYRNAVLEAMEGALREPPVDRPERHGPDSTRALGEAVAAALDLDLVTVDCDEHPCLAILGAQVPEGVHFGEARSAIERAVRDAGWADHELHIQLALFMLPGGGPRGVFVALGPGASNDDQTRISTRLQTWMKRPEHVSTHDWQSDP